MVLVNWYYGSTLVKPMLFTSQEKAEKYIVEFLSSYKSSPLDRFHTTYVGIEQ